MTEIPIPPRLRWACRRGMLELDLWLDHFLSNQWVLLTPAEKKAFEIMLEEPDPVLYRWLTRQETPEDPVAAHLIHLIRDNTHR